MPYRWSDLKKYLHYLTPQQQISEINKLIDDLSKGQFVNVNNKYNIIKLLKHIRHKILLNLWHLCIIFHHYQCYMSLSLLQIIFIQDVKKTNNALHTMYFQTNNKMKIMNTKASNEDSF